MAEYRIITNKCPGNKIKLNRRCMHRALYCNVYINKRVVQFLKNNFYSTVSSCCTYAPDDDRVIRSKYVEKKLWN